MTSVLIVGMGEVGSAHYSLLDELVYLRGIDIDPAKCKTNIPEATSVDSWDIMIVAFRYEYNFGLTVQEYAKKYHPKIIVNCSTVPVGTTDWIGRMCSQYGSGRVVHSTTRGLHPNLKEGLEQIPKHIGGDLDIVSKVAELFTMAGVEVVTHSSTCTTELAHILNNVQYGINLMFADAAQQICREYGVDYYQAVMRYTETNNEGYRRLANDSKVRPILSPPNGNIGGHCVVPSAELLPVEIRGKLIDMLANYNQPKNRTTEPPVKPRSPSITVSDHSEIRNGQSAEPSLA